MWRPADVAPSTFSHQFGAMLPAGTAVVTWTLL
jgi:hypothetical protein